MIKPTARQKLTPRDVEFILSTLGSDANMRNAVASLLAAEEERDMLLDSPQLFERMVSDPTMAEISPMLYFYVLVRHVLQEFAIDDRDVADYVASMLAEFSRAERLHTISPKYQKQYTYLVDLLKDLFDANNEEVFFIQSHVGNYSMFLVGLFPDYVFHRAKYRAAPDFSYYEQMGSTGYQQAARNRIAEKHQLAPVLEILGMRFRQVRRALNHMVDNYMNLDRYPQSTDRAMRRVHTFIEARKRYLS